MAVLCVVWCGVVWCGVACNTVWQWCMWQYSVLCLQHVVRLGVLLCRVLDVCNCTLCLKTVANAMVGRYRVCVHVSVHTGE